MKRFSPALIAAISVVLSFVQLGPAASAASSPTTTYTAVVTVSPPPNSTYVGTGGGDGWGLGFMPDKVFNVFHHATMLQV